MNPELVGQVLTGSWLCPKALSQIFVQNCFAYAVDSLKLRRGVRSLRFLLEAEMS